MRVAPKYARFANADLVLEGWYAVSTSRSIRRCGVARAQIGRRDVVLYRELSGALRAVDRACPHMGADLALGRVTPDGLQCAFHRLCSSQRGYEVRERWGLVWIWLGERPAYELPTPEVENRRILRLPPQRLACHPHFVLGNGLDTAHVVPVHRYRLECDPRVEVGPHTLSATMHVRFEPTIMRRLLGLAKRTAEWRFTAIGPSLAWVRVASPVSFEAMFAARPLADGTSITSSFLFAPRLTSFARALPMLIATTWADRRILDGLEPRQNFRPVDALFARYAQFVDAMEAA